MSWTLLDGFEDGYVSEWSVNTNWSTVSDRAYSGTYSAYESRSDTTYKLAEASFGEVVTGVELYFQETSGSFGGGYQLTTSSGDRVVGFGTGNPQWVVIDGSQGTTVYDGDGYDRWIRVQITLDYTNNEATYTFEDLSSGTQKTYTGAFDNVGNVERIEVVNISSETDIYDQTDSSSGEYEQWTDSVSYQVSVTKPSVPQSSSATTAANDQIDFSWSTPTDWGNEESNYRVEINRDGNGWVSPSGGPTTPNSGTTSASYGPNSDNSYASQVGIDSKFRFRVRAENSAGNSDWTYSDWVYTDPIPPHNPSVTRPDANTIKLTATVQSDISEGFDVDIREDTGSGYGSWKNFDNIYPNDPDSGDTSVKGSTVTKSYSVGTAYGSDTLQEDARYQFRIQTWSWASGSPRSEPVFADYGNEGNVYFEDDFESNDLSSWDTVNQNATTRSDSLGDLGVSGADSGTYYAQLDGGGYIIKQLGDLSAESDVIVKCALAGGSLDSDVEDSQLDWYDGTDWTTLRGLNWEYNKQGWVEVTVRVPSSLLTTDCRVRFTQFGGGGDYTAVDRVVVSDILHEYTKPAAPSKLSLNTSSKREITVDFTVNAPFNTGNYVSHKIASYSSTTRLATGGQPPYTDTGLLDGERYEYQAATYIRQYRNGSGGPSFNSNEIVGQETTILPAPSGVTASPDSSSIISVAWDDTINNGEYQTFYREKGGVWASSSTVSQSQTTTEVAGLTQNTDYEFKIQSSTSHTTSESNIDEATTYLNETREVGSHIGAISSDVSTVFSVSALIESHTKKITSDSKRVLSFHRSTDSHTDKVGSVARRSDFSFDRVVGSHTDEIRNFVYNDRTSLELMDYSVDWDNDNSVWYTPWVREDRVIGREDDFGLKAEVVEGSKEPAAKVVLQYDSNGNGVIDDESRVISVGREEKVHQMDIPVDDSGFYRMKISEYSGYNSLTSLNMGIIN